MATALAAANVLPAPHARLAAQESVDPSADLRDAVRELARDPEDVVGLMDAGRASLRLGDPEAAAGFFMRAETIAPDSGAVKVSLARARLQQEDPVAAIALFDEATSLGVDARTFAADRGLAYDLIGDFSSAQQQYEMARLYDPSPALTTRMAVSYDLSGRRQEALDMLRPLLTAKDRGAWRARAFLHAAHGEEKEALQIAESFLGDESAAAMSDYFANMPKLSDAQKMAAIHFGHFPATGYGIDSPTIAAARQRRGLGLGATLASAAPAKRGKARDPSFIDFRGRKQDDVSYKPAQTVARGAAGAALAAAGRNAAARPTESPARPEPEPAPAIAAASAPAKPAPAAAEPERPASAAVSAPSPAQAAPQPATVREPVRQPAAVAAATPDPPPQAAAVEAPRVLEQAPDLAGLPSAYRASASETQPSERLALADLLGDISIPASERKQDVVPVTEEVLAEVAEEAPEPPEPKSPEPAKQENPSRYWVQVATGDEADALRYDYRRFSLRYPDLFKAVSGWTSAWSNSHRLVIGPFDNRKAAAKWSQDFREAGGDGYVWQSDDGTVVEPLGDR